MYENYNKRQYKEKYGNGQPILTSFSNFASKYIMVLSPKEIKMLKVINFSFGRE